jgi:Helix-turn-helix domain
MGQGIGRVPEAPAVGVEAGGREPIGRYIAQQRRLRGIELEELALRTRIPRRSLERLEAGAFDQSPDGFSRGFVRTVAEAIGLDPDDAVARMLPEPDAARRGSPRSGRVLGALAAVAVAAGAVLAVRALVFSSDAQVPLGARGELPVRRDFVRSLGESTGIAAARLTERSALLSPLPPLVESPPSIAEIEAPPAKPAATTAIVREPSPPSATTAAVVRPATPKPSPVPNAAVAAVPERAPETTPAAPPASAAGERPEAAPAPSARAEVEANPAGAPAQSPDAEAHD